MERIYRLKYKVDDIIENLGHSFGKYSREFTTNSLGETVKVLKNSCVKCGAPVRIVDKPFGEGKYAKETEGVALEVFCKHGGPPVNNDPFHNYFATSDAEDYRKANEQKLAKLKRKHKMN